MNGVGRVFSVEGDSVWNFGDNIEVHISEYGHHFVEGYTCSSRIDFEVEDGGIFFLFVRAFEEVQVDIVFFEIDEFEDIVFCVVDGVLLLVFF